MKEEKTNLSLETEALGEPFFIVGAMRTGTTLLRLMLAAHSRLVIPPESHFIPYLYQEEKRLGGLDRVRPQVVEWLIAHPRLSDFHLEPEFFRGIVGALEPFRTRAIVEAVFGEFARRHGKVRWGEKTPWYRAVVPELAELLPQSKFIHILRDGRDTALSARRSSFGPVTWAGAAYLWRDSVRDAWHGLTRIPKSRTFELRYEDLLLAPESTLHSVCDFLQEVYEPQMLDFSRQAGELVPAWESTWHAKLAGQLDPKNAGKWKKELTAGEILLFQRVASEELVRAGYELQPVSAGPATQLRIMTQMLQDRVRFYLGRCRKLLDDRRNRGFRIPSSWSAALANFNAEKD